MEALPWLRRSASRCWLISPPCPIRVSTPRCQHAKVLYPLPEILLLVLAATLAGADDFVETTLWGTEHLAFLRRFYPYDSGIPSHDTLCDVFAALDPELFTHQSIIKTTFLLYFASRTSMRTTCEEMGAVLIIGRWKPFG